MTNDNLIYNKDGNYGGTSEWSANPTISDGVITWNKPGDLTNYNLIPVAVDNTYRITFDLKANTLDSSHSLYISLRPYDSDRNFIEVCTVCPLRSNTETTLASELKNGDTTATLTSNYTNWNSTTYSRLGICNNIAWGYKRASYTQKYSSRSDNVITFSTAWTGGTYSAGTKVAAFTDTSTYIYPWILSASKVPTEWTTYTCTFTRTNDNYHSRFADYIKFGYLGYSYNFSIRNLTIVNETNKQYCMHNNSYDTPSIKKNGTIKGVFDENIKYIRYIKDEINGSDANDYNHWVEIQAYDTIGNNVAFNKNAKFSTGSYGKYYVTDGSTSTSLYNSGDNCINCIVDLGFVSPIRKITTWHYWGDGRTYKDHKISVSVDGTNWETVYSGSKQETSEGISVYLSNNKVSFHKIGYGLINEIIEV